MPANERSLQEFISNGNGSMTVEFVILVPLLLSALVFSFEFGRALWVYDVMTRDVRAAVRYLERTPYDAPSGPFSTNAINIAKTGVPSGGTNHFPWGSPWSPLATVAVATVSNFSTPTFNKNDIVFSVTGSVPLTLSFFTFLEAVTRTTLGTNHCSGVPCITLVVSDQARHI